MIVYAPEELDECISDGENELYLCELYLKNSGVAKTTIAYNTLRAFLNNPDLFLDINPAFHTVTIYHISNLESIVVTEDQLWERIKIVFEDTEEIPQTYNVMRVLQYLNHFKRSYLAVKKDELTESQLEEIQQKGLYVETTKLGYVIRATKPEPVGERCNDPREEVMSNALKLDPEKMEELSLIAKKLKLTPEETETLNHTAEIIEVLKAIEDLKEEEDE